MAAGCIEEHWGMLNELLGKHIEDDNARKGAEDIIDYLQSMFHVGGISHPSKFAQLLQLKTLTHDSDLLSKPARDVLYALGYVSTHRERNFLSEKGITTLIDLGFLEG